MRQDPRQFRQLFSRFTTGVAVVLSESGPVPGGMTVNSLTSVSLDPMLLLFCARNDSRSAGRILESGRFTVNILAQHQRSLSDHFAGRREEGEVACGRGDGFVWIDEALAVFCCDVRQWFPGGDHRIILGEVVDMFGHDAPDAPLICFNGGYQRLG